MARYRGQCHPFSNVITRFLAQASRLARKSEQQVLTDLNRHIDSLNDRLQTADWLVANTISLADISVYSMITCIHDSREGQQSISRHSRVLDWMNRVEDATGGKVQGSMPPIQ